ncbi:MAG: hypothetical protein E6J05_01860 [Chloroflexi bacterium]|nr:MAG: hypothetical protein E6J05_01860 [Chloroflexota bacterium]
MPAQDVRPDHRPEPLRALAHDHAPAADDRAGQAADGVQERAHVDLRLGGQRMEHRAHGEVCVHEGLDLDVARALQHRRVRAHVQLDGLLPSPSGLRRRLHFS